MSRTTWIRFGVGAQLLCALGAFWYAWLNGVTPHTWLVALAACGAGQAVAVAVRPGHDADVQLA